ncbi:MAG: hypothetical protein FJ308_14400 [Planctomycetes bacterium]|nr:hypothetical protein [Planctomycetota bacterium]
MICFIRSKSIAGTDGQWVEFRCSPAGRRGLMQLELLVAAILLITLVGILSTIGVRLTRSAKDSKNYQIALHELANQMEILQGMTPNERAIALRELRLSTAVSRALNDCQISAEEIADRFGRRLRLQIAWPNSVSLPPVELVGWVDTQEVGQ